VARAFGLIRLDDALQIGGQRYDVCGRATLSTPDGEHWNEWLLTPAHEPASTAIAGDRHLWLSCDDDGRAWLWTPVATPPDKVVMRYARGDSLSYDGLQYHVVERDQLRVQQLQGDTGNDYRHGSRYDYLELRSGERAMTIEWADGDIDACLGRRIGDATLLQWAREAGTDLLARSPQRPVASSPGWQSRTAASGKSSTGAGWLLAAVIALPLIALSSCDDDDDCYRRYNPQTQKYERYCEGGLRYGSGRAYGGWGGK
jgi:hypothetical protein